MAPSVSPQYAISIREAARRLGVSRGLVQKLIDQGEIPVIRISRRVLVPVAMFDAWWAERQAKAARRAS